MAEWSTEYINDLPDAAFAVIEPGGEKDEQGKTVPRSLRHFPHHNASVTDGSEHDTVDLAHLRNALSRAGQSPHGEQALPHLRRHADALGVGEAAEKRRDVAGQARAAEAVSSPPSDRAAARPSTAVKFVGEEIIEGLAIPFGGPLGGRDLEGEDFGPDTDFALKWYDQRPLLYHHGMDAGITTEAIGRQVKAWVGDGGVWARAQLDRSHRYFEEIRRLVEAGKLFFSSGSLPHLVKKRWDGHIERWPWVELSLTPQPANPYAVADVATAKARFEAVGLKFKHGMDDTDNTEKTREGKAMEREEIMGLITDTLAQERQAEEERREAERQRQQEIEAKARELAQQMVAGRKIPMPAEPSRVSVKDAVLDDDRVEAVDLALAYMICAKARTVEDAASQQVYMAKGVPFTSEQLLKAMALKAYRAQERGTLAGKALEGLAVKSDEVMHSDLTSYGDEWVPTLWSREIWRRIRLRARVLPLFADWEMPSNPAEYPIESSGFTIYKVAETADEAALVIGSNNPFSDSQVTTGKLTFTAGKMGALGYFSEELVEDSIIPLVPQLRRQIADDMAHGVDDILINGDETTGTGNISYYGSSIGSTSRYLTIDGLRHVPLVGNTNNKRDGGAITYEDITATRKLMGTNGKYAVDPSKLVLLPDLAVVYKLIDLAEVITVDKYGPNATILTGELGKIMGIPIVLTEDYPLTDSSGYINATGSSNTVGSFLIVRRDGVRVGWRRHVKVTVGDLPYSDAHYVLASARFDVQCYDTDVVALSYNLTV